MKGEVRFSIVAMSGSLQRVLAAGLTARGYHQAESAESANVIVFLAGTDVSTTLGTALDVVRRSGATEGRLLRILAVSCVPGARAESGGLGSTALGAFFRSAAAELPTLTATTLELQQDPTDDDIVRCIVTELETGPSSQVCYDSRERYLVEWRAEDPGIANTTAPFDEDSVFAVTGGARGITGLVCRGLAERWRPVLELCGRSHPLTREEAEHWAGVDQRSFATRYLRESPGASAGALAAAWRELSRRLETTLTLDALGAIGARVHYSVVDAGDREAMRRWLEDIRHRHGKLDVLVHGAGVLRDARLADKTFASMAPVLSTKLGAADVLLDSAREANAHTVLFSSIAAVHGNAGQADYAAANENLSLHARSASQPVLSIAWGPWKDAGMTAGDVSRRLDQSGVALLGAEDGVSAFMAELEARTTGEIAILGRSA